MNIKIAMIAVLALSILVWLGSLASNDRFSKLLTREKKKLSTHTFDDITMQNCEDYAVIISASKLSKRLNRSKDWILQNYSVEIYADTLRSTPNVIGHAPPGSHCFIVEQEGKWFFIQTPVTNELGWLHQNNVVGFVKKDPLTLLPCPGRM